MPLLVTYTDPTGEVVVEATGGIQVGRRGKGQPRLDGAAATGDGVCVCGRFPGALAWRGLTLDGTPVFPLAASESAALAPLSGGARTGVAYRLRVYRRRGSGAAKR